MVRSVFQSIVHYHLFSSAHNLLMLCCFVWSHHPFPPIPLLCFYWRSLSINCAPFTRIGLPCIVASTSQQLPVPTFDLATLWSSRNSPIESLFGGEYSQRGVMYRGSIPCEQNIAAGLSLRSLQLSRQSRGTMPFRGRSRSREQWLHPNRARVTSAHPTLHATYPSMSHHAAALNNISWHAGCVRPSVRATHLILFFIRQHHFRMGWMKTQLHLLFL